MTAYRLRAVQGDIRGEIYPIVTTMILGRHVEDGGVSIGDALASRQHARIDCDEDGPAIEDLGSSNGTRVNGHRINGIRRLTTGDIITIGTTSLVLEDHLHPTAVSPVHAPEVVDDIPPAAPDDSSSDILEGSFPAELLVSLLANLPLAVLILDCQGRLLMINDHMKRLADIEVAGRHSGGEIIDMLGRQLTHPPALRNLITAADEGPVVLQLRAGGAWRTWGRPIPQGSLLCLQENGESGADGA